MLRRTLSAHDTSNLGEGDWITTVSNEPRLFLLDDGTGCVIELVPPGDEWPRQTSNLDGEDFSHQQELPRCFAIACHKISELGLEIGRLLPQHLPNILTGVFMFVAFVLLLLLFSKLAGANVHGDIILIDGG